MSRIKGTPTGMPQRAAIENFSGVSMTDAVAVHAFEHR